MACRGKYEFITKVKEYEQNFHFQSVFIKKISEVSEKKILFLVELKFNDIFKFIFYFLFV